MLSVDFSALEYQAEKLRKVADMIDDLEGRIDSKCSRLSEMSERDGLTAPLKGVLKNDVYNAKTISEEIRINAGKLNNIVHIYSDNEQELIKMADSLFIGYSELSYLKNTGDTQDFFYRKTMEHITPSSTGQFFSKQIINNDWLYAAMGDWRLGK